MGYSRPLLRCRTFVSTGFTDVACTSTSTSVSRSSGTGRSSSFNTSGEPCSRITTARMSVRDSKSSIERAEQPQRSDHQELHVLEKGRPLPFDRVTDELPDPGDDEDRDRARPQRPRQ